MQTQTTSPGTVLGWYRRHGGEPWSAAQLSLGADRLGVAPTAESTGVVPVEFVPLGSVTGLDEIGEPNGDMRTVQVVAEGLTPFDLAVTSEFVDQLVAALMTPAPPVAAPVAPVVTGGAAAAPTAVPTAVAPVAGAPTADAPTVVPPTPTAPTTAGNRRRTWLVRVLAVTTVLSLAATAGIFWQRATAEADRADVAEAALAETRTKLTATEKDLATTRAQLDTTRADLTAQKAKVKDLSTRVSELGNEKAKVQDERNAAQEVARLGAVAARDMVDCRDRLVNALQYLADGLIDLASSELDDASPVCQQANTEIAAFTSALG